MNVFGRAHAYFIPAFIQSDEVQVYRYRLVVNASLITSLFSFSYLLISLVIDFPQGVYLMAFNVAGFLCLPFLLKWRISVVAVGNLYVFSGTIAVLGVVFFSGGMHSPILPWLIAPPVLALLIVNRFYAILWTGVLLGCLVIITVLAWNDFDFWVTYDTRWSLPFSFLCASGIILIVVVIAMIFEGDTTRSLIALAARNIELERSKKELSELNTEIMDKNTELHAQTEEITLISEQLKALNEKKDDLMHIIAHDLKSPIGNIQALVRLAKLEGEASDFSRKELVPMIDEIASQAQALIGKLLSTENFEQIAYNLKLEELDIVTLVGDVVGSLQNLAGDKNVRIHFAPPPEGSFRIMTDKIYITQIVENLVNNAVKFSPSGSQVTVLIHPGKIMLRITIADEGPGIKEEEMDMLFKKFSKLSNQPTAGESSTGLGLSIVKHYVELLNGRVWCESEYGKGCRFIVELPIFTKPVQS